MTVIAWDGTTLAADKRASAGGGAIAVTTKIKRLLNGDLVGFSGAAAQCREKLAWFAAGAATADFPAAQRDNDKGSHVLLVKRADRTVWKYENTPHPFQVEGPFFCNRHRHGLRADGDAPRKDCGRGGCDCLRALRWVRKRNRHAHVGRRKPLTNCQRIRILRVINHL